MSSQNHAADLTHQAEVPARPYLPHARICPVLPASNRQGAETLGKTSDSGSIPPGHQRACADTSGHQADNSGHAMPAAAPTAGHRVPRPGSPQGLAGAVSPFEFPRWSLRPGPFIGHWRHWSLVIRPYCPLPIEFFDSRLRLRVAPRFVSHPPTEYNGSVSRDFPRLGAVAAALKSRRGQESFTDGFQQASPAGGLFQPVSHAWEAGSAEPNSDFRR
jgi:hypothetical protein